MKFYQWVKTLKDSGLVKEDSGPMSDFIDDMLWDPHFPRTGSLKEVKDYFSSRLRGNDVCKEASSLLISLYRECWPR